MNDSYNQIVADYSGADGGTGPAFQFSGTSIALQVIGTGTAVLQQTNIPDDATSWSVMLTQVGAGALTGVTERAYGRLVITGVARAVVSSAGAETGAGGGGGGTSDATAANQVLQTTQLQSIAGLQVPAHNYVGLGYTGSDLTTVTYRTGGAGGTVVGTVTLAYTAGVLTSVTRT